ncbi:hypothetical protein [uncultured Xylophilus sp.]|uniref:hypothetical protein n=1 Tax=uncultured Xylophilus sp. TaxID=296832 RepID=UPI0025DE65B8|nr:hypothetical protein [uncultured Xylophilus sp.]
MVTHALQILRDAAGGYCWGLLSSTETEFTFVQHNASGCSFGTYAEALAAGTLALAQADGEAMDDEPDEDKVRYDA